MKTITDEEKKTATLVSVDKILSDVDDTEAAFNEFRESFDTSDEPGSIKAWELQIDERGNVSTTKMQQRLGSWPIDAYKFDEICQMLIDQYMDVDKSRMAVRLVGTRPGQTGFVFNRIVMLKRTLKPNSSSNGSESTSSILKMMQEMNERNMIILQKMQAPPPEKPDTMAEIQKMMAFAQSMNAPMMTMLQSFLPALVGRPVPEASNPFTGLTGLLDVAERLSDMRGGGGEAGGDDNSFAGIVRALTPVVKPALEALPAIAAMQAQSPKPPPRVIAAPPRPPAAATVPAPPTDPTKTPTPVPPVMPTQPTDIPSGDSVMLAQLKPQIDSLVLMAQQGSDATGAADLIFDQVFMDPRLPEELYEKIANFIDSPQFVNYVTVMNPAAKPHTGWFEAFKTQIVKRLDESETTPDTPTAQNAPVVQ